MTWPGNQPLLLSPWAQSAAVSAAASQSSAFTTAMRGWGGTAQPEQTHHTSRPGVGYTNIGHRETEQK